MPARGVRALAVVGLAVSVATGCAGEVKLPEEPIGSGSPERLHVGVESGFPLPASTFRHGSGRPPMRGVPFRVADLPTLVSSVDKASGPERLVREVAVKRDGVDAVLSVPSSRGRLASLSLDQATAASRGGLRVTCGKWAAAHLSLAMLDIREDGGATFVRSHGIFDAAACQAVERSRIEFEPATLVPGYLFAYRTCTAKPCASGREVITFLMPPLVQFESDGLEAGSTPGSPAPIGVASFELARGSFGTMTAIVNEAALASMFTERPAWLGTEPMVLGIDIATTTEETEPVGLASFGRVVEGPAVLRGSAHEEPIHFH